MSRLATSWAGGLAQGVGRALKYPWRRPRRFFAVTALLVPICFGFGVLGLFLWADYHLNAGRAALQHYHNTRAAEHLQACLWAFPHRAEALLLLARAARRANRFEDAEEFLDRYEVVRGPHDEALILERVLLQAHRGQVERVRAFCFQRIETNHPDASLVFEAVASGFIRMFRMRDAKDCLLRWLDREPDNTQALLMRGIIYELRDAQEDALNCFRRVIELDPEHDEARLRMTGTLLGRLHRGKEALPHLQYLGESLPNNLLVKVRLAQCYDQMNQRPEAVRLLDEVLAREPTHSTALALRGAIAFHDNKLIEAEHYLCLAVENDPSNLEPRNQLFITLTKLGKETEASEAQTRLEEVKADLEELQKIMHVKMQAAPQNPKLHYDAGMIALRSGQVAEGLRWLQSAIEVDPTYAPAHQVLATYYQRYGNPARAQRHREFMKRYQRSSGTKGTGDDKVTR
jgi:tetratricopeptide (TPR) repeat protein